MDELGKVLPSLFRKQLRRPEPYFLEVLLPLWPRIVGKSMAQHSHPALFEGGVLTLTTDCATWSKQLRFMAEEIRAEINGYLGQVMVKKLKVTTATQPGLFSSPWAARAGAPHAPPAKQPVNTDGIADPEIAATLASSYAKYFSRSRS